tara:strand:- start:4555 stop:5247 length:693 start_codon:yes stop_codon:yes gene_type:complete
LDNYENINLAEISRIGLLGRIRKELIKENLIKNIELTDKEKEFAKNYWLKSNNINSSDQLDQWKRENIKIDNDLEFIISREFKWSKWCIDNFNKEIKDYFQEKKSFLDKYIYSIIRVKSEGLSKELFLRIKDKESDFYSIAKEFSEGIEKKTGGLVGPTNLNNPHPIISNILKESKTNQIWAPKKINEWWVIIRLEEKIPAILNEELKIKLSKELGEKYLKHKLNFLIKD